jgi:hypothetical protein
LIVPRSEERESEKVLRSKDAKALRSEDVEVLRSEELRT